MTATPVQRPVASASDSQSAKEGKSFHAVAANPINPKQPIAPPAASRSAARRPRLSPFTPARRFFSFWCFSIRDALAGKIAGNNPPHSRTELVSDQTRQKRNHATGNKTRRVFPPGCGTKPTEIQLYDHLLTLRRSSRSPSAQISPTVGAIEVVRSTLNSLRISSRLHRFIAM